jgi:hypothetical protein
MRRVGSSYTGTVSLSQGVCRVRTAESFVAGLGPQFQVACRFSIDRRVLYRSEGVLTHSGGLR